SGRWLGLVSMVRPLVGLGFSALGGLLVIVTLLASVVVAVRRGLNSAGTGLGIGAVITLLFVLAAMPGRRVPRINDITTDTANPPQFVKALLLPANQGRDMGYPSALFAEQQRAGYPDLGPFKLAMPPDEAFKRVEVTAERMPDWEIIRDDASARALEGVSSTRLFRFHDDFVIEVRPLDDGSVVQMRSKSRDG